MNIGDVAVRDDISAGGGIKNASWNDVAPLPEVWVPPDRDRFVDFKK